MAKKSFHKIINVVLIIFVLSLGVFVAVKFYKKNNQNLGTSSPDINSSQSATSSSKTENNEVSASNGEAGIPSKFNPPLNPWADRVSKKPFGIYITPDRSPVSPERFFGYHAGVDFEIFPDEQNIDVSIYAICSGPLLVKEWASGYGGLAVQACKLDSYDITVIYGHLKLVSIAVKIGQQISAGDKIGFLGEGHSNETDSERKHLHLGIHRGDSINIRGYVQKPDELSMWLDITNYLN